MSITLSTSTSLIILATAVLIGLCLIALAIATHTATMRALALDEVRRKAAAEPIDDTNWRWTVEQIAADLLNEEACVLAFSGMLDGRHATLRFVLRDGRALVFSRSRWVQGCLGLGQRIAPLKHAHTLGLLQAVWDYFARTTDQALPMPQHTTWFVMPLQPQQYRHQLRPPIRRAGKVSQVSKVSASVSTLPTHQTPQKDQALQEVDR